MIDYPCPSLENDEHSDMEMLKDLTPSQLCSLERLASTFNTTLVQLFRMVSPLFHTTHENSSKGTLNCVQALLTFADEYRIENPELGCSAEIGCLCPSQPSKPNQAYVILGLICSILMIAVAVFGIIGNSISVWFFGRLSTKSSINTMLTAMAVFDCVLLVTGAPLYSLVGIHSYTGYDSLVRSLSCCLIYFYAISTMSQTATAWMLVLITFERYIAVCRPFLARRLCTLGRARKAVLSVSAFAVAYNAIRFWEFESDSETGGPRPLLRNDPYYKIVYMHWMYLTLVFLIPFSIIAFFNLLIIRTIRAARICRRTCRVHAGARSTNSNGTQPTRIQSEHRTAAMLLVVVLVFMLCEVLAPILNALEMAGQQTDRPVFAFLSDLNNLLILLHSTVNVGIYIGFCSEFRRVCRVLISWIRRVFCCYRTKLKGQDGESVNDFSIAAGVQRRPLASVSSANGYVCTYNPAGNGNERVRLGKSDSYQQVGNDYIAYRSQTGSLTLLDGSTSL